MSGMSKLEIRRLMERYIGSRGGYLGTFDFHGTLTRFYLDCGLDIDCTDYEGTNKTRFQLILEASTPAVQAKIIRGILKRHPPEESSETRTKEVYDEFVALAARLDVASPIESPNLVITSEVVERAIADAEALITTQGATSGVDRLHTTLHGYLKAVCEKASLTFTDEATLNNLFKLVRQQHPAFKNLGPRAEDLTRVFFGMATIMDAMNPVRNNASMAHPNKELLDPPPEAMLVIHAARTILHYLNAKIDIKAYP